ncbi:MAG: GumC family protein [Syntrophaceae bacterium]|nr:GumC family protein [Syntrophaceae bacterium]
MNLSTSVESYPRRSLRDFHYVLFRHKWKIILFFLGVMITVTAGTFLAAEVFRAEAKLLVRIGKESVSLDPTATTGQTISIGQSRESEINSELEILRSRELALKVVDDLGPKTFLERPDEAPLGANSAQDKLREWRRSFRGLGKKVEEMLLGADILQPLDDREKAVIKLTKGLEIETQKNTNILFLSYEAQSPKLAENVLSKLIEHFLEKHISAHRTAGSFDFFDRQAEVLRQQLTRTDEELKALKNRTGVASFEEQRKITLNRIGALQQEAEATSAALAISRAKVGELKEKLSSISPTLVTQEMKSSSTHGLELMRARVYELRLKEQELLSKYTETSIPVKEVRRQIAEAQAQLAKEEGTRTEVTTAVNPIYQQLDLALTTERATLSSLEAKARVINDQLEAARSEIKVINDTELRIVNLQRDLALQDTKYRRYAESREQARIDQALETKKISNISVIQPASAPQKPVKPKKALNLGIGFFLAIIGGLGLAFFSEFLDHSIRTPEDIEEDLKLQLLASIPYMKKKK